MLSCGFLLGDLECGSVACGSAVALPQKFRPSELKARAGVHHRCFPAVYRADDLLRGDPFQVGAGG